MGTQIIDPFRISSEDVLGAAYGWASVYRDYSIDMNQYISEHLIEIYYRHQFEGIEISPFIQVIANGSAQADNAANAAVLGVRAHADF